MHIDRQRGNVLFTIMIAVVLFAALVWAVTSSGRGGSGTDKEKASLVASRLLQYSSDFGRAYTRMKAINGCDFDNTPVSSGIWGYNPIDHQMPAPCNIFHPQGGGLSRVIPDGDLTLYVPNGPNVPYPGPALYITNTLNIREIGTDKYDIILMFQNIREDVCRAVNQLLKIQTADGNPPHRPGTPWEGGWTSPYDPNSFGHGFDSFHINHTALYGKKSGCFKSQRDANEGYFFYYALEVR